MSPSIHRYRNHYHIHLCKKSKSRRGSNKCTLLRVPVFTVRFDLHYSILRHNYGVIFVSKVIKIHMVKHLVKITKYIVNELPNNKKSNVRLYCFRFFENLSNSYEFSNFYRPFYMRGIPFFAGLLAGVLVEELKKKGIKFSTVNIIAIINTS